MRSLLKRLWGDLWVLNTILFVASTVLLIGWVAERSWWWVALIAAVIAMLVWQGVRGWRSSAEDVEQLRPSEDIREAT